jgi:hypothetical protein
MNTLMRDFYKYWLNYLTKEIDECALGKPAIIFAPHQDDETLGCGGTIIRKKQAGANLQIVFMTDGCRSHAHLMTEIEPAQSRWVEPKELILNNLDLSQ